MIPLSDLRIRMFRSFSMVQLYDYSVDLNWVSLEGFFDKIWQYHLYNWFSSVL